MYHNLVPLMSSQTCVTLSSVKHEEDILKNVGNEMVLGPSDLYGQKYFGSEWDVHVTWNCFITNI